MRDEEKFNWRAYGEFLLTILTIVAIMGIVYLAIHSKDQVQDQRRYTIRTTCQDTNMRNRDTKAIVTKEFTGVDTRVVMLLIDSLAPYTDCEARVKRLVPE